MTDPDPIVVKQILSELRDVNKERRRTAVMKLGMLGGEEAVRALITVVGNRHEDLIARGRAALMLGKLGDARAVDSLIDALDAPGYQTPIHAAEALGKIGDMRAIEPLVRVMDENNDRMRDVAQKALRNLGYEFEETTAL